MNGCVGDIVSTVSTANGCKIYLFTAFVKHSQSLSLRSLKTWAAIKQSGEVVCAHCTCMTGIGEACSHVTAILFTVEANTNMKQQFSCTSLPCSWLLSSFWSVAFIKISKIDFLTLISKQTGSQKKAAEQEEGEPDQKKKIVSIPEPTENDLELFYRDLSKTKGKPVILSLLPNYNETYTPAYESGILSKPLTELHDPKAMNRRWAI